MNEWMGMNGIVKKLWENGKQMLRKQLETVEDAKKNGKGRLNRQQMKLLKIICFGQIKNMKDVFTA